MIEDLEETLKLQRAELEQLRDADFDIPAADAAQDLPTGIDREEPDAVSDEADGLASLCESLKEGLDEVRFKIGPLLEEVTFDLPSLLSVHSGIQARKGDLCTEQGLSYLKAKHLLLLHYCQCLVFYVLLKLEDRSVKDHPAVLRLVEIRTYLEKLRPLEARLQPQVDKLLRAVTVAARTTEGASFIEMLLPIFGECFCRLDTNEEEESLAPHPEELVPRIEEENGAYRPPKLHPVSMGDETTKKKRKSKRQKKEAAEDAMVPSAIILSCA